MNRQLRVYVAGKVSKNSVFGRHDWRDEFCDELERLSGLSLESLDPTKTHADQGNPEEVFGVDCYLISKSDVVIVYLSDDISIGGSQEILVAKYLKKPVIGLAPYGGKFNGSTKEYANKTVVNYKDPFVFMTCDVVCATVSEVSTALKHLGDFNPKGMHLISEAIANYTQNHLTTDAYVKSVGNQKT